MRAAGDSFQAIAAALNQEGAATAAGCSLALLRRRKNCRTPCEVIDSKERAPKVGLRGCSGGWRAWCLLALWRRRAQS